METKEASAIPTGYRVQGWSSEETHGDPKTQQNKKREKNNSESKQPNIKVKCAGDDSRHNDNDTDTLREVPHLLNEGLALQARV